MNWYDYEARQLTMDVPRFTSIDPLAEKYYSISPYAYVANNPLRNIDINGDSITILNMGYGLDQHLALLIQNESGKWQYFSFNGDVIFESINGWIGGGPTDDLGEKEFDSPEEFINSSYNTRARDKEDKKNKNTMNGYGFEEGYVLPTTKEQDHKIRASFVDSVEEGYDLVDNQCSQAIQKALNSVGIKTSEHTHGIVDPQTRSMRNYESNPYFPSNAYKVIVKNNPQGFSIKRK